MVRVNVNRLALSSAAIFLSAVSAASAAPITGPWMNAVGQGDGPIFGGNTNSPVVGDEFDDPNTNSNAADGEMIDSPFSMITLGQSGDKVVFTGSVTLSGTVNSPLTSGTPRTQFRFGLFDGDEDGPDDNGWVGYYMSNRHGNAGTPAGANGFTQSLNGTDTTAATLGTYTFDHVGFLMARTSIRTARRSRIWT